MMRAAAVRRCFAAAVAAALAFGSSAAFAASFDAEDDDVMTAGCRKIGCADGNRFCGTVVMTSMEWYFLPDYWFAVPINKGSTCYEPPYA